VVEKAWRWRTAFLGMAGLIVGLLWLGGWRLVEQERTLARQRTRERLENAASFVVRESERALARAPEDGSLVLAWDEKGLRRTAGVALVWSASPRAQAEAPPGVFAAGESLEFGASNPERAIAEYRALLKRAEAVVRAGALVRIARCERKLGRAGDALKTYEQLAALGATPAAGAPAELVALRERAALLEAAGQTAAAAEERERLRAALELGRYSLDPTTLAFYEGPVTVSERGLGRRLPSSCGSGPATSLAAPKSFRREGGATRRNGRGRAAGGRGGWWRWPRWSRSWRRRFDYREFSGSLSTRERKRKRAAC